MNADKIYSYLQSHKGQNVKAVFKKKLKTRKGVDAEVYKVTKKVVRGGIDYNNIKAVQEARLSGELPDEAQPLPWGKWKQFPFIIEHKGEEYARFYAGTNALSRPHITYFVNGEEVPKEIVADLCPRSEIDETVKTCFTTKVKHVEALG